MIGVMKCDHCGQTKEGKFRQFPPDPKAWCEACLAKQEINTKALRYNYRKTDRTQLRLLDRESLEIALVEARETIQTLCDGFDAEHATALTEHKLRCDLERRFDQMQSQVQASKETP